MHLRFSFQELFAYLFLFLPFCQASKAQTYEQMLDNLKNVIQPSPNAAGLGKYADWPVNLYSGVPSIGVPIYELKGRSLRLPISLSYHASGIRVSDVASWVGLGWSLEAGGMITRSVRGLPDECNVGYFAVRAKYPNPEDLSILPTDPAAQCVAYTDVYNAAQGKADGEADEFYFSAMGKSFKFLFRGDGSILTHPSSDVKLTADFANRQFTAILEDGTKLVFGGTNATEITSNSRISSFVPTANLFPSSWHLTKIIHPSGETFTFTYASSNVSSVSYSEVDYIYNTQGLNYKSYPGSKTPPDFTTFTDTQTITTYQVSTIDSDLATVSFIRDSLTRQDLTGDYALSKILVYSKSLNKTVEEFHFNHSYSSATNVGNSPPAMSSGQYMHRLKLNALLQYIPGTQKIMNQWQFSYNPLTLPMRGSFAQDHWGYYNGFGNATLLPPIPGFTTPLYGVGQRYCDPSKTQAEMLTQITYPTGGSSTFSFEQNSYKTNQEVLRDTTITLSYNLNYLVGDTVTIQKSTFTTTESQNISLSLHGTYSNLYLQSHQNATTLPRAVIIDSNGAIVAALASSTSTSPAQLYLNTELFPGTYTLKFYRTLLTSNPHDPNDSWANVSLTFKKSEGIQLITKYAGGVRVKRIEDYDGLDPSKNIVRIFQYDNSQVISAIDTVQDYTAAYMETVQMPNLGTAYYTSRSSVLKPMMSGAVVGYGTVTTLFGNNGANGKTVSIYSYQADDGVTASKNFPFTQTTSFAHRRGLLLSERTFDEGGLLKKKITNTYAFTTKATIIAFKTGSNIYDFVNGGPFPGQPVQVCGFPYTFNRYNYETVAEQVMHQTQTAVLYNAPDSVSSTSSFYYDNARHTQVTRTQTIKSDVGIKKTSLINYPLDYSPGTAFIDSLVQNNIVVPIETVSYMENLDGSNRQVLAGTVIQYIASGKALKDRVYTLNLNKGISQSGFKFSNGVIGQLPFLTGKTSFSPDPLYMLRLTFDQYDSHNNLVQYHKENDGYISYVWGYHNSIPVAEVTNAAANNVFYTSFEEGGTSDINAKTGRYVQVGSYTLPLVSPLPSGNYNLSYWERINNVWTYQQSALLYSSGNPITITTSNAIDEVRLLPAGALISTYTFDPVVGMTSKTSADNRVTYFEYDGLNRLKTVRDDKGRILKTNEYHYVSQGN